MVLDTACAIDRHGRIQPKSSNNSRKNVPVHTSSDDHEDDDEVEDGNDDDGSWVENLVGATALAAIGLGTYFYFKQQDSPAPTQDEDLNVVARNVEQKTGVQERKVQEEQNDENGDLTHADKKKEVKATVVNDENKDENKDEIITPQINEAKVYQDNKKSSDELDAKEFEEDRFREAVGLRFELKRLYFSKQSTINELFASAQARLQEGKSVNECFRNNAFIHFFKKLAEVETAEAQTLCAKLFQTAKTKKDILYLDYYSNFFFTYHLCALPDLLKYMVHPSIGLNVNGFGPRGNTCLHHTYSLLTKELKEDEKKAIWSKIDCLMSCRADPFLANDNKVPTAVADSVRRECENPIKSSWLLEDEDFKKFDGTLRQSCLNLQRYVGHSENALAWGDNPDFLNVVGYSKTSNAIRPAVIPYALKCLEDELLGEKNLQYVTRVWKDALLKQTDYPEVLYGIIAGYCASEEERFLSLQDHRDKEHYAVLPEEEGLYLLQGLIKRTVNHKIDNKKFALLPRSAAEANITRVDILLTLGVNTWVQYERGMYVLDVANISAEHKSDEHRSDEHRSDEHRKNSRIIWQKIVDTMITQRIVGSEIVDQKTSKDPVFMERHHEMESRVLSYLLDTYRRCSLQGIFLKDKNRVHDHNCQGRETHKPVLLEYIKKSKSRPAYPVHCYYTREGVCNGLLHEYMCKYNIPRDVVEVFLHAQCDPNYKYRNDGTFIHRLAHDSKEIGKRKDIAARLKEYIDICNPNLATKDSYDRTAATYWEEKLATLPKIPSHDRSANARRQQQILGFKACITVIEAAAKLQIEAGSLVIKS